ncbi:hypothetical protein F5141DRAFT_244031 [Pisolithus sp. B1]|nr:hypothetical protein F5141DRAFT_244031 [Pisolithus sp. B1]
MGKTGSGMSNFINKLTGMQPEVGADELSSCTQEVCAYECCHNGQRFIFVDTPGFNNQKLSQNVVFGVIARWLKEAYQRSIKLTGVIYTQNITDNSWSPTDVQSFQLLRPLCGSGAVDRIRLVMTMCDQVEELEADNVEGTLKGTRWKSLIQAGAQPQRFDNTSGSAWNIVDGLGKTTKTLLLQEELVDMGKAVKNTTAGKRLRPEESATLYGWFKWLFGF